MSIIILFMPDRFIRQIFSAYESTNINVKKKYTKNH